jgi:cytochrome c oxidase subunit II
VSTGAVPAGGAAGEPNHGLRIAAIWVVVTVIVDSIVIWVVGPHIPPGHASSASSDQHDVNVLLTALAVPVLLFIWVYFGYAIVVFRQHGERIVDGPPLEGNTRVQVIWLVVTSVLVLLLAVLGTVELFSKEGVGGGQGPDPAAKPSAAELNGALQVQVIGQQWLWTFRYPGYGGVETPDLVLPLNREVVFHVTSLDVAHSFWAYELGVKVDAIPGNDNVAYVEPRELTTFQVRCAELCGLWHGHMNLTGRVVSQANFATWIAQQQALYSGVTKYLPPYSHVYYPVPSRRA